MRDALYIYRGNILISVGDILNVKYNHTMNGVGLYVIRDMKKNDNGFWDIRVAPIKVTGHPDNGYSCSDLDELFESNQLDVYHRAGR